MYEKYNFTPLQQVAIILLAGSFWLNGVFLIRLLTAYSLWGGAKSAIIFAVSVPIIVLSIKGVRSLLRVTQEQFSPAILLIVGIVAVLHGGALTWTKNIYGSDSTSLMFASAWLVWFCGVVLFSIVVMEKKK